LVAAIVVSRLSEKSLPCCSDILPLGLLCCYLPGHLFDFRRSHHFHHVDYCPSRDLHHPFPYYYHLSGWDMATDCRLRKLSAAVEAEAGT
jgi:hypothetical protein